MRTILWSLAGLAAAAGGEARAEDWRAVSLSHHDVVFIDADSVRRRPDGRIAFRARHRLAENASNRDFGYDRIDLAVSGRCAPGSDEAPPATSTRSYFLRGRGIGRVDWREAGVADDSASLTGAVCHGLIGYRSFADLEPAMTEYGDHDSLERLAASVSEETELTGTVVQGFEINAISLCASAGCSAGAPTEFCWLEGPVHVPAPPDAPGWVSGGPRRDAAGVAFRGRIHRSRTGNGFGHMGAYGCLVEVTGPVRFDAAAARQAGRPEEDAPGRRAETVTAHAALEQAIAAAGAVATESGGRRWTVDSVQASSGNRGVADACYSVPRFGGNYLQPIAPSWGWPTVRAVERAGAAVTLASSYWDDGLDFHLASAADAARIAELARRIASRRAASVAQAGRTVTVRYGNGRRERLSFADPARAIQAAAIADRMLVSEIAEVRQQDRRVTALPIRRVTLTFADEAKAAEVVRHMEALRSLCSARPVA